MGVTGSPVEEKTWKMCVALMQRMANEVGRDGVVEDWGDREVPVCARAFFNRVLCGTGQFALPAQNKRDRRECETLCVLMDLLAQGKFRRGTGCLVVNRLVLSLW